VDGIRQFSHFASLQALSFANRPAGGQSPGPSGYHVEVGPQQQPLPPPTDPGFAPQQPPGRPNDPGFGPGPEHERYAELHEKFAPRIDPGTLQDAIRRQNLREGGEALQQYIRNEQMREGMERLKQYIDANDGGCQCDCGADTSPTSAPPTGTSTGSTQAGGTSTAYPSGAPGQPGYAPAQGPAPAPAPNPAPAPAPGPSTTSCDCCQEEQELADLKDMLAKCSDPIQKAWLQSKIDKLEDLVRDIKLRQAAEMLVDAMPSPLKDLADRLIEQATPKGAPIDDGTVLA